MDENVFQAQEQRYHLSFLFLFKSGLMQSYTPQKKLIKKIQSFSQVLYIM